MRIKLYFTYFIFCISYPFIGLCQTDKYIQRTIAFYNVENLFDTIDHPQTIDEAYTPKGKNHYSHKDYVAKIKNTAKVISAIGFHAKERGPEIIGLAEIENIQVLKDLVSTDELYKNQYQVIHYDSPDRRGIDVAILYQEKFFSPTQNETIELKLWNDKGERIYTRDILYVEGILDDEIIHIFVNHWPSRRGGKTRSDPKRMKAAYLVKKKIDQILMTDPDAIFFILGDFNDDPIDKSIKNGLLSPSEIENESSNTLFNPMEQMFRKGFNSLAYRDGLNLFDQILLSKRLLKTNQKQSRFVFFKAGVYNPVYLISQHGKYKGYPLRSFVNNRFAGGYSDHFPVYVKLIKPHSSGSIP